MEVSPSPKRDPSVWSMADMRYAYILSSTLRKRFYIGVTQNPNQRLMDHNRGKTKSTKPYRPWEVVYLEKHEDKHVAYRREYYLKHPVGYLEKIRIIKKALETGGVA
jgi:putative endonuclease